MKGLARKRSREGKTYCRTCFDPGKSFLALTELACESKSFLDLLREVVREQILHLDPLPKTICGRCSERLKDAYEFIVQAHDVGRKYRNLLASDSDPLDELEIKQNNLHTDCLEESTIDMPPNDYTADVKVEEDPSEHFDFVVTASCSALAKVSADKGPGSHPALKSASDNEAGTLERMAEDAEEDEGTYLRENDVSDEDYNSEAASDCSSSDESLYKPPKKLKCIDRGMKKRRVGRQPPEYFNKIRQIDDRYACIICEKTFSLRKDCGRHIASIHLRQTTFTCEYCGQEFCRKDKVRTHIKRMHSLRAVFPKGKHKERVFGDRLYGIPKQWCLVECKICGSKYSSTKDLSQHLKTHNDSDTLSHLQISSDFLKHLFPNIMSLERVKASICKDIGDRQWFKYYTVLNEFSYEMSISDTEAEDVEKSTRTAEYRCELCDEAFAFKFQIYSHMKLNHAQDEAPFKCGLCKLDFVSEKMFDSHTNVHCRNRSKILLCTRCPAKFVWPDNMRNHSCATKGEMQLDKEPMKCHICDRAYEVKTKLLKHIETHDPEHPPSGKPTIRCALCAQTFVRLKKLRSHISIHADGVTGIDFNNSIYLKIFEKSKTIDRALLQQEIQNAFKTSQISRFYKAMDKNGNEMDILDSESGSDEEIDIASEMQYKCELCCDAFKRRKLLLQHQLKLHSGVPLPYTCDDCTRQFVSNELLQQHLLRDCWNEYRRVAQQCEYCNARFIWQSNLLKHKEVQHKHQKLLRPKRARTLKCEYCEKVFIWPKDLVRHKKTHTEGKQFACPHCDRKFQRKDNLLVHIRTHDPDVISLVPNSSKCIDRVSPHLMKPHGCKLIKCMICHSEHNRIPDLRSHLRSHQFRIDFKRRKDFDSIEHVSRQLYPEEHPMDAEMLSKRISTDIAEQKNLERFYSITDECGYEVNLDSSDTESESDNDNESVENREAATKNGRQRRIYKCDMCPQLAFNRKYKVYEHHFKDHKWEEGHHICIHCNSRFVSSNLLQLHYKEQCKNARKRHFCRRCPIRFMWKSNLKNHIAMNHASIPDNSLEASGRFECFLCQCAFLSEKNLSLHMSSRHSADSELHYCLLCPEIFCGVDQLNDHMIAHHHLNADNFSAVESVIHSTCWPNGEKAVKCMICCLSFKSIAELGSHLSPDNAQNNCATKHSLANYSITNQRGFELHLELDSETEPEDNSGRVDKTETRNGCQPYICAVCGVSCERKYQMAQHQRSMHKYETLPLKCQHCIFKTVSQPILDHHIQTQCENLEKQHQCALCKFKFMWKENLNQHISLVHNPLSAHDPASEEALGSVTATNKEDANIFECMECHRRYNRRDRYKAHFKKFHSNRIVSPAKSKDRGSQMKTKHFLCPFCGVNFSSNSNLTVHMRRHTGEKPFKCDLCEMAFPRSSDLQSHRRTHTGERPYKCTFCDKSFSRQYKLNVHTRIHTGERPYACTYCPKSFTQSNDLTLHVRRHTGERPYSCEICGERFICATSLKQHKNTKGHQTEPKEEHYLPSFELNC